jgi:hypothetical protein
VLYEAETILMGDRFDAARHPAVPQLRSSGFSAGAVATGVDSGACAVACEA